MTLHLLFPGKALRGPESELVKRYLTRCAPYAQVKLQYVSEPKDKLPLSTIQSVLPKRSYLVALDVAGKSLSTEAFSQVLERQASRPISFVIGASYGLSAEILKSADLCLSLSALTLPHKLALVVLTEQIYRALSFMRGHPYHHAD